MYIYISIHIHVAECFGILPPTVLFSQKTKVSQRATCFGISLGSNLATLKQVPVGHSGWQIQKISRTRDLSTWNPEKCVVLLFGCQTFPGGPIFRFHVRFSGV